MRIIGGRLKGRQIVLPMGYKARPTTDFAKEGLFNILTNLIDFTEVSLLDLFSGTGAISYEFASRGCPDVTSIEMAPDNARFIKQRAHSLGLGSIRVIRHNVFDFVKICSKQYNIIFADPPYAIEGLEKIPNLAIPLLTEDGLLILEHPGTFNFEQHPNFLKEKKYGNVHFSLFTATAATAATTGTTVATSRASRTSRASGVSRTSGASRTGRTSGANRASGASRASGAVSGGIAAYYSSNIPRLA